MKVSHTVSQEREKASSGGKKRKVVKKGRKGLPGDL